MHGIIYKSKDEKIKITYSNLSFQEYLLVLGPSHFFLGKGVLEELARTPIAEIKEKLNSIDPSIDGAAFNVQVGYTDLDFALKQARINDLEKQVSNLTHSH